MLPLPPRSFNRALIRRNVLLSWSWGHFFRLHGRFKYEFISLAWKVGLRSLAESRLREIAILDSSLMSSLNSSLEGTSVPKTWSTDGNSSCPLMVKSIRSKACWIATFARHSLRTCAANCERSTPERMMRTRSLVALRSPAWNVAIMPPRSWLCRSS